MLCSPNLCGIILLCLSIGFEIGHTSKRKATKKLYLSDQPSRDFLTNIIPFEITAVTCHGKEFCSRFMIRFR
jgi:hypothetical protein